MPPVVNTRQGRIGKEVPTHWATRAHCLRPSTRRTRLRDGPKPPGGCSRNPTFPSSIRERWARVGDSPRDNAHGGSAIPRRPVPCALDTSWRRRPDDSQVGTSSPFCRSTAWPRCDNGQPMWKHRFWNDDELANSLSTPPPKACFGPAHGRTNATERALAKAIRGRTNSIATRTSGLNIAEPTFRRIFR